ncbi:MAG TPA: MFS transporter [Xanthobacteraceae bacterium]|nr:MFS transporter [Xanthobacteraceae bacterium]
MALAGPSTAAPPTAAAEQSARRRAMAVGCGAHAIHDGFVDVLYIMLPLWQAEFALPYAAVGALRTTYTGTMAALQIPATLLADRIGAPWVLALGTGLAALCYALAGVSAAFPVLVAALFLGGLGASAQHPIGSALVARAFEGPKAITAIGTYNFAGDIGKMALPALATLLLWLGLPWRATAELLGGLGLAAALAVLLFTPRFAAEAGAQRRVETENAAAPAAEPHHKRHGFRLLLAIAACDSLSRAGFMVFVPFLLIAKGASIATAGFLVTLIFVGGAAGKLVCAWIGARFGIIAAIIITELLTAAGILGVLWLPLAATLVLLPAVGIVLNGTSSLTYGSVPQFILSGERNRAFGIFYTGTLGAGALSPTLTGALGDLVGMNEAVLAVAAITLATVPLVIMLRRHMRTEPV